MPIRHSTDPATVEELDRTVSEEMEPEDWSDVL